MVKKIIVKYSVSVNGEWFFKEKFFTDYKEAFEFMSSLDQVYKFQILFIKNNK